MCDTSRTEKYGRLEAMAELTKKGYATTRQMNGDGAEFTVYVQRSNTAGGELAAILRRHGYAPVYPKPYDGDEFVFSVRCEPACWHEEFTEPRPTSADKKN